MALPFMISSKPLLNFVAVFRASHRAGRFLCSFGSAEILRRLRLQDGHGARDA